MARFTFNLIVGKKYEVLNDIDIRITGGILEGNKTVDNVTIKKGLVLQRERVPNSDRARFKILDKNTEIGHIIVTSDAEFGNALEKEYLKGTLGYRRKCGK